MHCAISGLYIGEYSKIKVVFLWKRNLKQHRKHVEFATDNFSYPINLYNPCSTVINAYVGDMRLLEFEDSKMTQILEDYYKTDVVSLFAECFMETKKNIRAYVCLSEYYNMLIEMGRKDLGDDHKDSPIASRSRYDISHYMTDNNIFYLFGHKGLYGGKYSNYSMPRKFHEQIKALYKIENVSTVEKIWKDLKADEEKYALEPQLKFLDENCDELWKDIAEITMFAKVLRNMQTYFKPNHVVSEGTKSHFFYKATDWIYRKKIGKAVEEGDYYPE